MGEAVFCGETLVAKIQRDYVRSLGKILFQAIRDKILRSKSSHGRPRPVQLCYHYLNFTNKASGTSARLPDAGGVTAERVQPNALGSVRGAACKGELTRLA
jgi:hypothetical protein